MINSKYNQPEMNFVPKNWGYEKWICNTELYCGKLLHFVKGKSCSFHMHKTKDETFYVQSGSVLVRWTDDWEKIQEVIKKVDGRSWKDIVDKTILKTGDNFYIPPRRVHQIIALETTELFEFSTQHQDSDSYRIIKSD